MSRSTAATILDNAQIINSNRIIHRAQRDRMITCGGFVLLCDVVGVRVGIRIVLFDHKIHIIYNRHV